MNKYINKNRIIEFVWSLHDEKLGKFWISSVFKGLDYVCSLKRQIRIQTTGLKEYFAIFWENLLDQFRYLF